MDPLTSDNKTKRPASEVRQCPVLCLSFPDDYSQTILSVAPHVLVCCKYAHVCQNYNAHLSTVNIDTPTRMYTSSQRKKSLHTVMCKKEKEKLPQKAKQDANATTQWDERDRYENDLPMRQSSYEEVCYMCHGNKQSTHFRLHFSKTMNLLKNSNNHWIKCTPNLKKINKRNRRQ